MTRSEFLLSLVGTKDAVIRDTWVALGSLQVTSKVKRYIKDTFFKVNATPNTPLDGALVYCNADYNVNDIWLAIDWDVMSIQDTNGKIGDFQGVETPFFTVILTKEQIEAITDPVNEDLIPFEGLHDNGDVVIDDEYLIMMLTELGVPFLRVDELEYTRDAICKYCIKPAMITYYGFFPIMREEVIGTVGPGGSFKREMPKDAFYGVPFYILGAGGASAGYGSGAFALYREQMIYGGGGTGGGAFGRGLSYKKPVPGWVGLESKDAALQGLQAQQGYINYFRREHIHILKENGKKYITGYSTVGGSVNVKWLCASWDFDDIRFSMRTQFMKLAKANILRSHAVLRDMAKTDVPGAFDASKLLNRADNLEKEVMDVWNASPTNHSVAIMRGGL